MTPFTLALVLSFAAPVPPGEAKPGEVLKRPTESDAVKFLQQDRLEEAARLLPSGSRATLGSGLLAAAKQAEADGKTPDALCIYEAYLRHNPIEGGAPDGEEWYEVTTRYLALLDRTEKPTAAWFRQSQDALKIYDRIQASFNKREPETYLPLVDEIIAEYPRSLFVQQAVRTAWAGAFHNRRDLRTWGEPTKLLRSYLRDMEKAEIPPADRVLVWLALIEQLDRDGSANHRKPDEAAIQAVREEVRKVTRSLPVRRQCMLGEVYRKLNAKDRPGMSAAAEQFLLTYPEKVRDIGRSKLLNALYLVSASEEILAFMQTWREEKARFNDLEGSWLVAKLYAADQKWDKAEAVYRAMIRETWESNRPLIKLELAQMYRTAEKWDRVEAVYQEIINESGPGEGAPVKLLLAQMYQTRQNKKKMVPILQELARAKVAERSGAEFYGPNTGAAGGLVGPPEPEIDRGTSTEARGMLARYYYAEGNWNEALRWYQAWEPSSWYGTCYREMINFKAKRIAECREKLGLKP